MIIASVVMMEIENEILEEEKYGYCFSCHAEPLKEKMKVLANEEHCLECYEELKDKLVTCDECSLEVSMINGAYRHDVIEQGFGFVCKSCDERKGPQQPYIIELDEHIYKISVKE